MNIRSLFPFYLECGEYSTNKEQEKKRKDKPPTPVLTSCVNEILSLIMSTPVAMPIKMYIINCKESYMYLKSSEL